MARLLPFDPRPSKAEPQARSVRKEVERSNSGFSWKTAAILGVIGVTVLLNVEKGVEKCEQRHQRRGDWDTCRNVRNEGKGGSADNRTGDCSRIQASKKTSDGDGARSPRRRETSRSRYRSKSVSFKDVSDSGPGDSPNRGRRQRSAPGRDKQRPARSPRPSSG